MADDATINFVVNGGGDDPSKGSANNPSFDAQVLTDKIKELAEGLSKVAEGATDSGRYDKDGNLNKTNFESFEEKLRSAAARILSARNAKFHNSAYEKAILDMASTLQDVGVKLGAELEQAAEKLNEKTFVDAVNKLEAALRETERLNGGGAPAPSGGGSRGGGGGQGGTSPGNPASWFDQFVDNFLRPLTKASFTTTLFRNNMERAAATVLKASVGIAGSLNQLGATVQTGLQPALRAARLYALRIQRWHQAVARHNNNNGNNTSGIGGVAKNAILMRVAQAAAAGLASLAPVIGSIVIAIGGLLVTIGLVIAGFLAALFVVKAFNRITQALMDKFKSFNGSVAIADARNRTMETLADRANAILAGPAVARNSIAQADLSRELERLQANIYRAVEPIITVIATNLTAILELLNMGMEANLDPVTKARLDAVRLQMEVMNDLFAQSLNGQNGQDLPWRAEVRAGIAALPTF